MQTSDPPLDSIYVIILIILLLFSMFFSASETAFLSSSRLRIRYLKEKKNKAASRVEKILQKKDYFLNGILIGNNIVNISVSALITALSIEFFGSAGVGIATAFATIIILIFGEILPKSIALLRPEKIALRFSLPLSIILIITAPIVSVFSFITRMLTAILGVKTHKDKMTVTEEDIRTMIEVGEEEGLIESKKRDMMHRILKYTDLNARDIMTPRTDIITINIKATRKEILALSHSSHYSRFPVYGDDIDDIKGILYIKDFLFASDLTDENFSVTALLRPALFVFETQKISVLQERLRSANQNIAIIIDEFGGTSGIITTDNLIEEIFGDIKDEYDKPEPQNAKEASEEQVYRSEGLTDGGERLDEINDRLGLHLSSKFYDTIGGFIMEKSGDIPFTGLTITEQGYSFTVTLVSGNRIEEVRIDRAGGNT